ncbi:MAG: S49 family peptidase [Planctomycetia bacterium]|nr:S49 family peptidase [Planctomycetia bacterium]
MRQARESKPLIAFIESIGASAAYHLGSQCDRVVCEQMSLVGSIGATLMLLDLTGLFAKSGIKAIPINSTGADYKSTAAPGTAIVEKDREHIQSIVDYFGQDFLQAVALGRRMSPGRLSAVADGRVFPGPEALRLGLVDAIGTLSDTVTRLRSAAGNLSSFLRSEAKMDHSTNSPATLAELKNQCPDLPDSFYVRQLEAGATIVEAQRAAIGAMQEQVREARSATTKKSGVKTLEEHVGAGFGSSGGGAEDLSKLVTAEMKASGVDRQAATVKILRRNPQLHEELLIGANEGNRAAVEAIHQRFT